MNSVSLVLGNEGKRPIFGRLVCHSVNNALTVRSVPSQGTGFAERLLK
jgi:hypothetical protein